LDTIFYLNNDVIPFKSELLGYSNGINEEGMIIFDAVVGLMRSNMQFPKPVMHWDEFSKEYQLLYEYFFGDNYIITLSEDEKNCIWEGLGRYIRKMVLSKP